MSQLKIYLEKFRLRLTTQHLLHLKRLIALLEALDKYAQEWRDTHEPNGPGTHTSGNAQGAVEVMTSGDLLRRLGNTVDGVNLLEVGKYLRQSKVRDA